MMKYPIQVRSTAATVQAWALTSWVRTGTIRAQGALPFRPLLSATIQTSTPTSDRINSRQLITQSTKRTITTTAAIMSDTFSNTNVKNADPYKEANTDSQASLEQKIQDLSNFMQNCKFGMMTTRDAKSGKLVSRCMALAAQVCFGFNLPPANSTLTHTN
jgi:hypothetical protein